MTTLSLDNINFYDHVPIGVCIIKRDRKDMDILYANNAFAHMLTLQGKPSMKDSVSAKPLIGKSIEDIWPSKGILKLTKKLNGPQPEYLYNLAVHDNNSKMKGQRWAHIVVQPVEFAGQEAFTLWITDISSTKESEQQLEKAVAEADEAANVKANFLATMSHEIRTPMQSVYGLLDLISEEKPDHNIDSMVNTAKDSASGLLEILDDILDFAKMDANKMELDNFEVPVRTLVRGINEALAVKIHGQHVELLDDIEQEVPFVIAGDPKRLRQIIMNLTGNALKFTKQGSVTIAVRKGEVLKPAKDGLAIRFEVIDTGIGMKQEAANKLFQPFTQADSSTSRKYGGTGLGLSICKKLVDLMGGEIGIETKEGKGSTFWFEIPTEEIPTDKKDTDLPSLDGLTVLSVEDHPQGAKEIVRSLESMGANVESCATYQEGLDLIQKRPFDVGIIDQGLPDGLGLDLMKEITKLRPYMGLVMYTVRDDIGLQHSLNSLGATYLSKPASRRGLGETVKDAAKKEAQINLDGPRKLLIAEDTETVRDVLSRQLEKIGIDADFVENGAKALEALKSNEYGILITDLHMPEIDGYGVIKAIRDKEGEQSRFPVILLTADVQMTQRQVYLDHGFDECLLKPVSLGQFRRLLIRWGFIDKKQETVEAPSQPEPSLNDMDAPVNKDKLKQLMGSFDETTIKMLHMFIDMTETQVENLKTVKGDKDISEAAHSLKGAARSACCDHLGDLADKLQTSSENAAGNYASLIKEIEDEFRNVSDYIKSMKV